jgi:dTDP-4-amino-4,6-dideoxy-D-glucose acyltransferase
VISAGAGGISIGRHVHVAVFSLLIGGGRIELHDYANLSSRVSVYSSSDDYSGAHMTNPTVPAEFTGVTHAPVTVGPHVIIGSGSIVLPGCTLHEGSGVGALSLVRQDLESLGLYAGVPARRIGKRRPDMLRLAEGLQLRESAS